MTDPKHPLTDDVCQKIIDSEPAGRWGPEMIDCFVEDLMRAAYDKGSADMLEQAIGWLEDNAGMLILSTESKLATRYLESLEKEFIQDFKKAMRPQIVDLPQANYEA